MMEVVVRQDTENNLQYFLSVLISWERLLGPKFAKGMDGAFFSLIEDFLSDRLQRVDDQW